MGFAWTYMRDFPAVLDALAPFDGDVTPFLASLQAAPKLPGSKFHVLMVLAMAASYDPDPAAPAGIRLPVDPETCALDTGAWARWLAHDPVHMIEREACRGHLASLAGLFIDCGRRDQYFLHYGARALVRQLRAYGIEHRYEEFDDDHSSVDYRLDVSLPFVYRALTR
jgi:S-formylglutathione hydrolase FrmB